MSFSKKVQLFPLFLHIYGRFRLNHKSATWALNMVLFKILWCWYCSLNSFQIAPLEGAVPASNFLISLGYRHLMDDLCIAYQIILRMEASDGGSMYVLSNVEAFYLHSIDFVQ